MLSPSQRDRLADAAELYWGRDLKVEAVGRELGVSRSTVSRMLAQARAEGVVEFLIHRDPDSPAIRRQELEDRFGIQAVIADVPADASDAARRLAVGREAAGLLLGLVQPDSTLAVTWGSTIEAVSSQLTHRRVRGLHVVQMHGSGNVASLGKNYGTVILDRFGGAFGADVHLFPVPAIFDSAQTRRLMWQEGSIRRTLAMRAGAQILLTSVGVPDTDHPSRLYESGFLTAGDVEELARERTVGNLASIFFRADGSTDGIAVNDRSTGMPFDEVRRIPVRLFVAAEAGKTEALRAALTAGLVTHLVVDSTTARELVAGE
ncbi:MULTISPECIES: sugar-binding transcriptional regulator [Brachybacterium]|uniref:Sugar-binding transcriptional regulator n=2 Tax=Brachybacterium TaxID=43668 RepID=A0ABS1B9X4_9MICO|nr:MULTISPECIES: sugar-binding domain-containing protein [Brachybacterium]MBK0331425.1 sugar-binding transcriptional regulator [Brachybacterium halotolerans]UQN28769.1 sugar-binding transcriptional regulator [Brachybacterium kimchii]